MKKHVRALILASAALLVATSFFGCGSHQSSSSAETSKSASDLANEPDVTFKDLQGKDVTLASYKGKVVLVNFWGTWCPPCRKEMPDIEALYDQFKDRGLVVLAISQEDAAKVKPFIAQRGFTYPVLLDPGGTVNRLFVVEGIPKSFVYDRSGKLVAESIDMCTRMQFLAMLAQAGLH